LEAASIDFGPILFTTEVTMDNVALLEQQAARDSANEALPCALETTEAASNDLARDSSLVWLLRTLGKFLARSALQETPGARAIENNSLSPFPPNKGTWWV
jgi:hypothetical protein